MRQIYEAPEERGFVAELESSNQVAHWEYERANVPLSGEDRGMEPWKRLEG